MRKRLLPSHRDPQKETLGIIERFLADEETRELDPDVVRRRIEIALDGICAPSIIMWVTVFGKQDRLVRAVLPNWPVAVELDNDCIDVRFKQGADSPQLEARARSTEFSLLQQEFFNQVGDFTVCVFESPVAAMIATYDNT